MPQRSGQGKRYDILVVVFALSPAADDFDFLTPERGSRRRECAAFKRSNGQTENIVRQYGVLIAGGGAQYLYFALRALYCELPVTYSAYGFRVRRLPVKMSNYIIT